MKKVAFIGCSYSDYRQAGQQENSWTWNLAQRFPQNTYRNYARGGRGPDFFHWALVDAKKWRADVVFVNATHPGRISFIVSQTHENERETWQQENVTDNYSLMEFVSPHIWIAGGKANVMFANDDYTKKFAEQAALIMPTSSHRERQDQDWYRQVTYLYNFPNIFLLNFDKRLIDYGNGSHGKSAWHLLMQVAERTNLDNVALYKSGLVLAPTDDHWTQLGNKIILENYILTPEVISALS